MLIHFFFFTGVFKLKIDRNFLISYPIGGSKIPEIRSSQFFLEAFEF